MIKITSLVRPRAARPVSAPEKIQYTIGEIVPNLLTAPGGGEEK